MSPPSRGRTVRDICAAARCADFNLCHYKYHGGKVQHVLQADGIAQSFMCPIQNHDALVLHTSLMIMMLSAVYIGGNLDRLAITKNWH